MTFYPKTTASLSALRVERKPLAFLVVTLYAASISAATISDGHAMQLAVPGQILQADPPQFSQPPALISHLPEAAVTPPPLPLTIEERLLRIEAMLETPRPSTYADTTTTQGQTTTQTTIQTPNADTKKSETNPKWSGQIGGQIMADYINWANASEQLQPLAQNVFNWRRVRLNYDAKGYDCYDFRVQFDIEPDNELPNLVTEPFVAIKDIYLGISDLPWQSRMRFGNFFIPFSLEQLTPLPNVSFIERAIPTTGVFSPAREVGMAWYLLSDDENKSVSLGAFFDDIPESTKEVIDDNQGLRLSSRVVWLPFYDSEHNGRRLVHVGFGSIYTWDRDDVVRFRATPGELREVQRVIDTGIIPSESYLVSNAEFATVLGPLSLHGESYLTHIDRIEQNDIDLFGSFAQASYFLTGEHRRYDRNGNHIHHFGRTRPNRNFSLKPGDVGFGAWEAKARWSTLDFTDITRGQYNDLSLGLNWYWNEHARWSFEWIRAWTDANAHVGNTLIGATRSDLLAVRMQFTF